MKDITAYQGGSPFGDNDDQAFKPGTPSTHEHGVLYQGPWETQADGFNEHVRRCARALAMTGCPVHLRGLGPSAQFGVAKALAPELASLVNESIARYSVQIQQVVLNVAIAQYFVRHKFLGEDEMAALNRFRVVSTVFEADRVSPDIIGPLKSVGQVWVACQANVDMLERCGLDRAKIRVVPVPYFDDDPLLALRGRVRKPGVPRFYHIGKWEPRKAQDQIIGAFMKAFRPGQASLTLKTSALTNKIEGYPQSPHVAAMAWLEDSVVRANGWTLLNWSRDIDVILTRLAAAEMLNLHRFGDVYVTLSRGEGFDMPAFDAVLAGNRLVYTPSGGPQDFAAVGDFMVPASGTVPCHPFYGWPKDAKYLDFDVVVAAGALQRAAELLPYTCLPGRMSAAYRAEIVGENMLRNLHEVVGKDGKVW